jgi:hypothetical protein
MHRRREGRAIETCEAILAVEKINSGPILKPQAIKAPDLLEECDGVMVTAHEKVLAIINYVACLCVNERICATAQMFAAFERQHSKAGLAQTNACRKPAESASYDDDALFSHLLFKLAPQPDFQGDSQSAHFAD